MTISEFARQRGVEPQTVSRYIGRHGEIQKHTKKVGREVHLSEEAEQMLEAVYPLPKPVTIVEGVPQEEYQRVLKALAKSQEAYIRIQQEQIESQSLLAQAEAKQILLEDKERQLADERVRREAAEKRAEEALLEVERLRGRNLWQRIKNA